MGESIVARLLARIGVALAILLLGASPAFAQTTHYDVVDAHGATKAMAAKPSGSGPELLHGQHVVEGMNAGVPVPVNSTVSGQLDVNCVSGCSSGGTVTVQQPTAGNLNATVVGNVGITGTLPAFAATPTFNCGTGCSAGAGTAQGATSAGVTGGLGLSLVTTSAPTYTTGTVNGLSLDTSGNLRVTSPAGAATSANQSTEITALNLLHTDNGSLATSANQTTANGSLATLAAGVPDVVPTPGTITAADVGTTTVAGQSGVVLVTGTPTANSFQTWAVNGRSSLNLLVTGTFVETMQLEGSADGGVTYVPISGLLRGTATTTASITAPAVVSAEVAGFSNVRLRSTSFTSGTATITPRFSVSPGPVKITNPELAGTNTTGDVGSASFSATCTVLTLPSSGAGTYASGQLVANAAAAGSVTPFTCTLARYSGGPITVTKMRILTSTTGLTGAAFRGHLYTGTPTVTSGNGGVFLSTASGHFCRLDITVDQAFSDGADGSGVPVVGTSCIRQLSATAVISGLLEARGAYAWTNSQTLTMQIEGYN